MRYKGENGGRYGARSPDPLSSRINDTPFDIIVSSPRPLRTTPSPSPTPMRHPSPSPSSQPDHPQPSPSPLPPHHTSTSLQQQPQPLLADPTNGNFGMTTSDASMESNSGNNPSYKYGNQVSFS